MDGGSFNAKHLCYLGSGVRDLLGDGPYNTKDPVLVTRPGQSMGQLFVRKLRILFWSDDLPKPHTSFFYDAYKVGKHLGCP